MPVVNHSDIKNATHLNVELTMPTMIDGEAMNAGSVVTLPVDDVYTVCGAGRGVMTDKKPSKVADRYADAGMISSKG